MNIRQRRWCNSRKRTGVLRLLLLGGDDGLEFLLSALLPAVTVGCSSVGYLLGLIDCGFLDIGPIHDGVTDTSASSALRRINARFLTKAQNWVGMQRALWGGQRSGDAEERSARPCRIK